MVGQHENGFMGVIHRRVRVLVAPPSLLDGAVLVLVHSALLSGARDFGMPNPLQLNVDQRIMGGRQARGEKRQQDR